MLSSINGLKNLTKSIFILLIISLIVISCDEQIKRSDKITANSDEKIFEQTLVKQLVNTLQNLPVEERSFVVSEFLTKNPTSPIFDGNEIVTLFWYGRAECVSVLGDMKYAWSASDTMNNVNCGDSIFFYKSYKLPADTRIDYLLKIDTILIVDPRNDATTPSGFGTHSQISMPLFKVDKIRAYNVNVSHGSLDTLTLTSSAMPFNPRKIIVYKHAGYDSFTPLPVLYVNDGYKALEYCQFTNVIDNLIAEKKIKPIVVVFIKYEEGDSDYFLNRTDEYVKFLTGELIPFIDEKYKTSRTANDRAVSGISAGGSISLLTAITHPEYFSMAAGQSSTITENLFDVVENINFKNEEAGKLKLYLDVGRYDLLSGAIDQSSFLYLNQMLDKKLTAKNVDHHFKIYNDGHQWANWRERIDDILIYFFGL